MLHLTGPCRGPPVDHLAGPTPEPHVPNVSPPDPEGELMHDTGRRPIESHGQVPPGQADKTSSTRSGRLAARVHEPGDGGRNAGPPAIASSESENLAGKVGTAEPVGQTAIWSAFYLNASKGTPLRTMPRNNSRRESLGRPSQRRKSIVPYLAYSEEFDLPGGALPYMSAQNTTGWGSVTCKIKQGGENIAEGTSDAIRHRHLRGAVAWNGNLLDT